MLPMGLNEFQGHKLVSVDSAQLNLDAIGDAPQSEDSPAEALEADAFAALQSRVRTVLGGRVSDVRESRTLVDSPARLVSDDDSANRYMFRINRLLDKDYELPVKALELNPRHPLTLNLGAMLGGDGDAALVDVVIEQIFETALLQDGIHPDPSSMANRLTLLMQAATGSDGANLDFSNARTVISEPVAETPGENLISLDDIGDLE